ncbi:MAG: S1 RNA-binding domain-containing protein [Kiritimatiellae bacterium]|nr:S1 RNA-binding domain-containing protein [Kiritimatiellia bacterium]
MNNEKFDFGALVDAQFKNMPRKKKVEAPVVSSNDNVTIKAAWDNGEAVSGLVEKEIKGGFEVTVAGQRCFCPFSQIDKFKKESAEYIGRKFDFLVSEYSTDDRGLNVIVSRRALMEVEEAALKEALLQELNEGETLNGTVTRVMDFGAFVDLGGIEGLIPAREVAWERVNDISKVLKSGDGVTVKILKIDREEGKLTLSRKECLSRVFKKDPAEEAAEKSAAEVAAWMENSKKKNASFGTGFFDSL